MFDLHTPVPSSPVIRLSIVCGHEYTRIEHGIKLEHDGLDTRILFLRLFAVNPEEHR